MFCHHTAFTKSVNMHYKFMKELTQKLLSSGQGVLSSLKMEYFIQTWEHEVRRWNNSSLKENVSLVLLLWLGFFIDGWLTFSVMEDVLLMRLSFASFFVE